MIQLPSCSSCGGFLGLALTTCPHCGTSLSRARTLAIGMVTAVAGGAVSMTLMACYGMSCVGADCADIPDSGGDASDGGKADAAGDAATDATTDATSGDSSTDSSTDSATDAAKDAPAAD